MELPFDAARLDALLDSAGIDLLLATDKDTVQYLTGGYRFFFLAHKDAIGAGRYMPVLGYQKGTPQTAFYIGCGLEPQHQEVEPLWVGDIANNQWTSEGAGHDAAVKIRKLGLEKGTIAVEMCFLPADAYLALREDLPNAKFVDAHPLMQEMMAVKRPDELALLRTASEFIIEAMTIAMTQMPAGSTTEEIAGRVKLEEIKRGMNFEYCLTATGSNLNRTPSKQFTWNEGEILSLDSGANLGGYLGDLCRMAVIGEPTQQMKDMLAEVQAIQAASRKVVKPGVTGREIYEAALEVQAKCEHNDCIRFVAHGMGITQHEAPHLKAGGTIPYPAPYYDKPLEAGMVLSIETDLKGPEFGLIKLEDTVALTTDGYEAFGDTARDWTISAG